jgi:hypothetical protein
VSSKKESRLDAAYVSCSIVVADRVGWALPTEWMITIVMVGRAHPTESTFDTQSTRDRRAGGRTEISRRCISSVDSVGRVSVPAALRPIRTRLPDGQGSALQVRLRSSAR